VLSKEAILDDVMADYANKTVTFEVHPHKPKEKWASIHPCNHGKVMKKMIDTVAGNGGEIKPHQSLFTFLKFISSVVPTIEYDFTVDLELD
jgi:ubiquitin-like-conjugating enzyme ATG3